MFDDPGRHALVRELEELRLDNARLRKLLDLSEQEAQAARQDQPALHLQALRGPVTMSSPPEQKVRLFQDLFRARTDIYAVRWENAKDGRSGWVPAVAGGWRKGMKRDGADYLPLTAAVIAAHLRGQQHIGLYPLTEDDKCWWVAADFDGPAAMLDALAYAKAARFRGIPAALEVSQSGRGSHVWIFFDRPIAAEAARQLATGLIHEAIGLRGSMDLASYDRLFPSQDTHSGKGMGNLIAAPLNGKRRLHGTTLFLDTTTLEPYEDQWAYLSSLDRLSPGDVVRHVRRLPTVRFGHEVRRLELPESSKIVPRPALIIHAKFAARLTVPAAELGPAMVSAVKHAASMPNPEFYDRQRQRRSTWNIPRFLRSYDETLDGGLVLPRGLLPLLTRLVESAGSTLRIEDERSGGTALDFTCTATLRPDQQRAVDDLAAGEQGILVAPPGTGKTVMACELIARRGVSTLILVDRKALADQWRTRVQELTGEKCGQIGGGRAKTTGRIDVALLPTLARRENIAELTAGYGFVIADECHHVPAAAFSHVMNQIPARCWLGLTATPYRRDRLDELMFHQLGQVVHTMTPQDAEQLPSQHSDLPTPVLELNVHSTSFIYDGDADPSEPGGISRIYKDLVADQDRLEQIACDVLAAQKKQAKILLLTTWKSHLDQFAARFRSAGLDPVVFSGSMKAKERRAAVARLAEADDTEALLVLGTGSYIGEGFDCPQLDTLFLAAPISFKGRLVQYAGRITRPYPGKTVAVVHDYHDELTPVLAASLNKRAPGYVTLGFPDPRKQSASPL
ncbi:Helicase [Arthrobacter crystallopoietes BAB-32]|uniref:Helicase n=1 Tax=Arthrobacter crystallopoietes BAB-32 TaxID=1246476 RepID=N1UXT2_9MICC|nr:DEAD/DEAH box helicase [Arthrobacter crystallopoietes]EMY33850.1 Helicase [Arthrobacter crystallopoietes BAB-32]